MTDMPTNNYEDILEACWQALLTDTADLDACLKAYPNHTAQLNRDLQLALVLRQLDAPPMSQTSVDKFEKKLRAQFQATMPNQAQTRRTIRPQFWLGRTAAAIMLAFLIALGGTGVTVAASADSMPDETLYVVKRWWESVVVMIGQFIGNLDEIWLQIAQTRLEEWLYMTSRGDDNARQILLDDLAHAIQQAHRFSTDTDDTRLITFALSTQTIVNQHQTTSEHHTLNLVFDAILPPAQSETPQAIIVLTATPTDEPPPPTMTQVPPPTATPITEQEVRATSTPRFPPTPTFTATPRMPSVATNTPEPTHTPTLTWTPLPILPSITPQTGGGQISTATPMPSGQTDSTQPAVGTVFPFIRLTEQAVSITQTAEAQATEEVTPP